jgi:hypothetical protein
MAGRPYAAPPEGDCSTAVRRETRRSDGGSRRREPRTAGGPEPDPRTARQAARSGAPRTAGGPEPYLARRPQAAPSGVAGPVEATAARTHRGATPRAGAETEAALEQADSGPEATAPSGRRRSCAPRPAGMARRRSPPPASAAAPASTAADPRASVFPGSPGAQRSPWPTVAAVPPRATVAPRAPALPTPLTAQPSPPPTTVAVAARTAAPPRPPPLPGPPVGRWSPPPTAAAATRTAETTWVATERASLPVGAARTSVEGTGPAETTPGCARRRRTAARRERWAKGRENSSRTDAEESTRAALSAGGPLRGRPAHPEGPAAIGCPRRWPAPSFLAQVKTWSNRS